MSDELLQQVIRVLSTYSGRDKAIRTLYFSLVLLTTRLSRWRAEFAGNLLKFAKQLSQARLVGRQLNHLQLFNTSRKLPSTIWSLLVKAYDETRMERCQQKLEISSHNTSAEKSDDGVNGIRFEAPQEPSTSTLGPSNLMDSFMTVPRFLLDVVFRCRNSSSVDHLVDETLAGIVTLLYTVNSVTEFIAWISDAKLVPLDAKRWFRYTLNCWICALSVSAIRFIRRITLAGWTSKRSWPDRLTLIGNSADLISALNMLPSVKLRRNNSGKLTLAQSASLSLVASAIGLYKNF